MNAVASVADVLDAAADRLAKPGAWTGGADVKGCHCAWSAILEVSGKTGADADEFVPGVLFFARMIGAHKSSGIWAWNDAPERTQNEVVAKLREAAALARQEQSA